MQACSTSRGSAHSDAGSLRSQQERIPTLVALETRHPPETFPRNVPESTKIRHGPPRYNITSICPCTRVLRQRTGSTPGGMRGSVLSLDTEISRELPVLAIYLHWRWTDKSRPITKPKEFGSSIVMVSCPPDGYLLLRSLETPCN